MNRKLLVSLALATLPLLWASGAQAVLLVEYSTDGGATFSPICTSASGTPCTGSVTNAGGTGINLTFASGDSDSPGTPTLASLLSSALSITKTTAGVARIELRIGDTGVLAPTAPPNSALRFDSGISGFVLTPGASNTLSYISCIDQGNGQNVCPGTFSTAALTPAITGSGLFGAANFSLISLLSPTFSMTQDLVLTLSAGSTLGYLGTSQLTPVPEPLTMFLGGTGLLALGYAARRRLFGR